MTTQVNQERTVTSTQLRKNILRCVDLKRPLFIWGTMGIGKSEIVADICKELNGLLFDVRMTTVGDASELRGMPYFDSLTSTMKWAPPIDLPSAGEAAKYKHVFLFLDELPCAPPSIQAAAYQLIWNRQIGTYKLPENVTIIAAGNRQNDRGVTYQMPKPLANRFMHQTLRVDYQSWEDWAIKNRIHPSVIGFLNNNKHLLHTYDPVKDQSEAFATPRTWTYVSDILYQNSGDAVSDLDLISGCIGDGLAIQFDTHLSLVGKLPEIDQVLSGKVQQIEDNNVSIQYSLMTSLLFEMKDRHTKGKESSIMDKWYNNMSNMIGFLIKNFDREMVVVTMKMAINQFGMSFDTTNVPNFDTDLKRAIMKSVQASKTVGL